MTEVVRLVLVDDEPLALQRMRAILSTMLNVEVAATAGNCRAAREAIVRHRPDLVLLDVQIGDETAFDLLESLPPNTAPMVAFATAYLRYASDAFGIEAIDYLLKPVQRSQLAKLVEKAERRRRLTVIEDRALELERIVAQLRQADGDRRIEYDDELWVRRGGVEHVRVLVASIDWISATDDYVTIHCGEKEHLLRSSLEGIEQMLDPAVFSRIHRSSIVRIANVEKVVTSRIGGRKAVLKDGRTLSIGRTYVKRLGWAARPG